MCECGVGTSFYTIRLWALFYLFPVGVALHITIRIFYEATEQGNESKIRLNQQRRREL
ncbi:hypothetical protein HW560_12530 [Paenibacillus sp. E222]|uniref:hypothetical protein n=1 Tax=Paenibacillus sp. E222 TaxID=2748863 RepID=UPI0015C59D76|nr:hypothetical protein [Paenibacillus sp. E222]QLG38836.1 hypothetical protein HW560_12530 [Paenibacillus sp. E222]